MQHKCRVTVIVRPYSELFVTLTTVTVCWSGFKTSLLVTESVTHTLNVIVTSVDPAWQNVLVW